MLLQFCLAAVLSAVRSADVVAFTKGIVSHTHLTKGEIITYDKDITVVNAVFTADGKFQTNIPGIYSFHFHSLSRSNGQIWLELYKNSEYLVSIYAYTPNDWADAGNSVIIELQKGDLVYVKAVDDYDNAIYGTATEIYTTFSGELIKSERVGSPIPVAFSVALEHNITLSMGEHVVYDKILVNVGNAYNQNMGEFTVPVDGLYVVHYHALSEQGQGLWLDLYVGDKYINSAFAQARGTWADAGNTAILLLNSGDKISVSGRPGSTVVLYGGRDEVYATFSAALLAPKSGFNQGTVCAFSVGLTRDTDNSGTNHNVIYDKIFTNEGSDFNFVSGVFTANVPGVYVFHYHALSDVNSAVWLELYHNDQYVNSLYGHSGHGWAGGSNTATLELAVHDTVHVDMRTHNSAMSGQGNEIYGTFSGYLLT